VGKYGFNTQTVKSVSKKKNAEKTTGMGRKNKKRRGEEGLGGTKKGATENQAMQK